MAKAIRSKLSRVRQSELAEKALQRKREALRENPPQAGEPTARLGMKPLPEDPASPPGALDKEGHRPVLERSRKVR